MNKIFERFRKLYDELVELKSINHWKYWAESLADEVTQLEAEKGQLLTIFGDIEDVFKTHNNDEININWIERKVKKALGDREELSVAADDSPETESTQR